MFSVLDHGQAGEDWMGRGTGWELGKLPGLSCLNGCLGNARSEQMIQMVGEVAPKNIDVR